MTESGDTATSSEVSGEQDLWHLSNLKIEGDSSCLGRSRPRSQDKWRTDRPRTSLAHHDGVSVKNRQGLTEEKCPMQTRTASAGVRIFNK